MLWHQKTSPGVSWPFLDQGIEVAVEKPKHQAISSMPLSSRSIKKIVGISDSRTNEVGGSDMQTDTAYVRFYLRSAAV